MQRIKKLIDCGQPFSFDGRRIYTGSRKVRTAGNRYPARRRFMASRTERDVFSDIEAAINFLENVKRNTDSLLDQNIQYWENAKSLVDGILNEAEIIFNFCDLKGDIDGSDLSSMKIGLFFNVSGNSMESMNLLENYIRDYSGAYNIRFNNPYLSIFAKTTPAPNLVWPFASGRSRDFNMPENIYMY